MLKVMIFLSRRPDLSAETFEQHLRTTHAPLVAQLPGLRRLVVNRTQLDPSGGRVGLPHAAGDGAGRQGRRREAARGGDRALLTRKVSARSPPCCRSMRRVGLKVWRGSPTQKYKQIVMERRRCSYERKACSSLPSFGLRARTAIARRSPPWARRSTCQLPVGKYVSNYVGKCVRWSWSARS